MSQYLAELWPLYYNCFIYTYTDIHYHRHTLSGDPKEKCFHILSNIDVFIYEIQQWKDVHEAAAVGQINWNIGSGQDNIDQEAWWGQRS